jgi:hypothetical protein
VRRHSALGVLPYLSRSNHHLIQVHRIYVERSWTPTPWFSPPPQGPISSSLAASLLLFPCSYSYSPVSMLASSKHSF